MTPRQIALVRQTWIKVQPVADEAARLFYERMFQIDPELRRLFQGDLAEQGRKLTTMLAVLIHGLERIETLATVQDLALRHVRYGVRPEHYATAGEALLWTLERGLSSSFTEEVKQAWLAFYAALARRMQSVAAAS